MKGIVGAAAAASLAWGCAVGPDFRRPEAPGPEAYSAATVSMETATAPVPGGTAQRVVLGADIIAQWWTLYHSSSLDAVIRRALENNPTLAAARAALRQSQENLNAVAGSALYPGVDAGASVTRQKISGAAFGQPELHISPFTLYNASVSVSYGLDLFGGARRELEALQSQVEYQRFQLEGAYLALTANIVTAAVKEASLRAQLLAMQEIAATQEKQLELVKRQFELGAVARADVLAQRSQLAQTRAALPPLEKDLAQTRHQLTALVGRFPGENALPEFHFDDMELPPELPLSLPSSVVRQRPDIRASEALLHAASAQIGVATANLYPRITLTGGYGSEAVKPGSLFSAGSTVWNMGAGLLQPLFHGGELSAKRRAAVAAYDQSLALYRSAVLQAFQNVADVLRALDADARTLQAQAEAEESARETLDLTQKQFELGAVNYLSLLNAERQFQQARIGLIQAQALRFADTAALFQALGGGWWNREQEAKSEK